MEIRNPGRKADFEMDEDVPLKKTVSSQRQNHSEPCLGRKYFSTGLAYHICGLKLIITLMLSLATHKSFKEIEKTYLKRDLARLIFPAHDNDMDQTTCQSICSQLQLSRRDAVPLILINVLHGRLCSFSQVNSTLEPISYLCVYLINDFIFSNASNIF